MSTGTNSESASLPQSDSAMSGLLARLMNDLIESRRECASERDLRESAENELRILKRSLSNNSPTFTSTSIPSRNYVSASMNYNFDLTDSSSWSPSDMPPRPLDQRTVTNPNSANSPSDEEEPRLNLLQALDIRTHEDEEKVITVRKVHKLGFRSQSLLKRHFSQYGQVYNVILLPMRARPKPRDDGEDSRSGIRPSSMGFVVMADAASAQAALSQPVQEINQWPIEVRAFVRPSERPPLP